MLHPFRFNIYVRWVLCVVRGLLFVVCLVVDCCRRFVVVCRCVCCCLGLFDMYCLLLL